MMRPMTIMRGLVAFVVFLQLAILIANASGDKCGPARIAELDNAAARMGFLGDHSFRVPKTGPTMEKFCAQLNSSISAMQSFSRECLQGLTKQVITSLLKRGKHQNNAICHTQAARDEFVNKMSCLSDEKIMNFHPLMDSSTARMEFIRGSVKGEQSLPALCCSYQLFFAEAHEVIGRLCGSNADYGENLIVDTVSDFLQLVCDSHSSLEQCRTSNKSKETLKKLENVTKLAKAGKIKNKTKSLVPPLIEILDSANN